MTEPVIRPPGAVLAGGASRRFGRDKAAAPLAGRPMAAWAASALRPHAGLLLLVGGAEELARRIGAEAVADRRPGGGPLAGLEAALTRAREEEAPGVVLLACDLPLVPAALVAEIVAAAGDGAGAVVPDAPGPGGVQPLCAYYPVSLLPLAHALLDEGAGGEGRAPSVRRFLEDARVRRLPLERVSRVGPPEELFLNVNTPGAAERARRVLEDRTPPRRPRPPGREVRR